MATPSNERNSMREHMPERQEAALAEIARLRRIVERVTNLRDGYSATAMDAATSDPAHTDRLTTIADDITRVLDLDRSEFHAH